MRVLREFAGGVALYGRALTWWRREPGVMLLGLVPGLIVFAAFAASLATLIWWLDDVSRWLARELVPWEGWLRDAASLAVGLAVIVGAVALAAFTFLALTSVVGQPFFERISRRVDDALGAPDEAPATRWWESLLRGAGESLVLVSISAPVAVTGFFVGLVPVVGSVAGWLLTTTVGGWLVAIEYTTMPGERRGLRLAGRRRALARIRPRAIGFGAVTLLVTAIPGVGVLMLPVAVVGGTLLMRDAASRLP